MDRFRHASDQCCAGCLQVKQRTGRVTFIDKMCVVNFMSQNGAKLENSFEKKKLAC